VTTSLVNLILVYSIIFSPKLPNMPASFLSDELYRIPVPLQNSWPYIDASWIELAPFFMLSEGTHFHSMDPSDQQDYCNTTLRFHMNQARWHGRWRSSLNEGWKWKLNHPPNGVPELSLVTSATFIARAIYGELVRCWNTVYIILTLLYVSFYFLCSSIY
jgi:hypothetical protein